MTVVVNGERVNLHIHRLAAYFFYGGDTFEEGICVRHLNGDVLNVSAGNIALGSYSENERDKPPELRSRNARKANRSRKDTRRMTMRKFSCEDIIDIKTRLMRGETGASIARSYDVVKDTIYQIKHGETYSDIQMS